MFTYQRVRDLLLLDGCNWNWRIINDTLGPIDGELIKQIPLDRQAGRTPGFGTLSLRGTTLKSGYKNVPGFHNNMGTSSSAELLHGGSSYGTYRSRQRLKSSNGNVFMLSCQLTPIFVLNLRTYSFLCSKTKMTK